MNRIKQIVFTFLVVSLLTGCNFIGNIYTYNKTTKEFAEKLLKKDYSGCVDLMAMEHEMARNTNIDTMKMGLANFRKVIVDNWGTDLDYSFMKAEKKTSTNEAESTPPNTTRVLVEFNNNQYVGIFEVLFDDESKKILNIKTLESKEPVPSMLPFWLFGIIALCVPAFNIYMIVQIKRSNLHRKWIKYITVILLNTPAFTFAAIGGLSFSFINFQFLLGVSFGYAGFHGSYWTFALPLGGLFWFWKLRQKKNEVIESETMADLDLEAGATE